MTAEEALAKLEADARADAGMAAALVLFRAGRPAALALTTFLDRPATGDTPRPRHAARGEASAVAGMIPLTCRVCLRPVESGKPHNGCAPYLATPRRVDKPVPTRMRWPWPEVIIVVCMVLSMALVAFIFHGR